MTLVADISNIFIDKREKHSDNALVAFLADSNLNELTEDTCQDIFHLNCIANSIMNKLTICKVLVANRTYVDLAIHELVSMLASHPEVADMNDYSSVICEIITEAIHAKLQCDTLTNLMDCLEMLYALGNHKYREQLLSLYRRIDSDIRSKQSQPEVIRAKLAILAYSANKYNAADNLIKMSEIYHNIKRSKQNSLKGVLYYYHGIFYSRTNVKELHIPLKKAYSYMDLVEGCFQKAKSYGFWLAECLVQ